MAYQPEAFAIMRRLLFLYNMAIQFSDTTTKNGLIQKCEVTLYGDNGYGQISSNTNRLFQFTGRINEAMYRYWYLAMTADGRWQIDDKNYTDTPVATTSLASGQRDYTMDSTMLEIEKVLIKNTSGEWTVIKPIDQNDPQARTYLEGNSGNTGTPTRYDKRGDSIIFDVLPDYSSTGGIKVYFKRGHSEFVYTDTTKVAGIPLIHIPFISLHASCMYAIDNTMTKAQGLNSRRIEEEDAITIHYSKRSKDEKPQARAHITPSR